MLTLLLVVAHGFPWKRQQFVDLQTVLFKISTVSRFNADNCPCKPQQMIMLRQP